MDSERWALCVGACSEGKGERVGMVCLLTYCLMKTIMPCSCLLGTDVQRERFDPYGRRCLLAKSTCNITLTDIVTQTFIRRQQRTSILRYRC